MLLFYTDSSKMLKESICPMKATVRNVALNLKKREGGSLKIKQVNKKSQKICTYLQIIAFYREIKTFVSTQIHKCRRSVRDF